ncbi:MAG TPA: YicC/YloC family endoribonuclease [Caulobacteraceae bacterium]|nr:YicC/YloC family endoribonuclease [Caulobacteraceae bacterium]
MALSGMTGFAREDAALETWSWAVEARSVNGRNMEARFRGPPGFDALERAAREGCQARFQRGQITLGLQAKRAETGGQVRINTEQLDRYLAIAASYAADGKAPAPAVEGLMALKGVIEAADDEDDPDVRAEVEAAMVASIDRALDGLKAARLAEGRALTPVLTGLVDKIETLVAEAEREATAQVGVVKERFERRMAELVADRSDLADRIVQEAALLAAKADVQEELDRLKSHVAAARGLIGSDQAAGRRLDFLTQEFMREANTLCSKSATTSLTKVGLELKATIEQLREQVQNVE